MQNGVNEVGCDLGQGAQDKLTFMHPRMRQGQELGLHPDIAKQKDVEIDPLALADFLNSPERVRLFASHKLLEFLNRVLSFTSPSLVLGLYRDASASARETARDATLQFIDTAAPLLPLRVREAFTGLARHQVEEAFKACQSARGLTLRSDPEYDEQKERLQALVGEAIALLVRLANALTETKQLPEHLMSPRFVAELFRFRGLPTTRSREILRAVVGRFGISDPDRVFGYFEQIRDWALTVFHEKGFHDAAEALLYTAVAEDDHNPSLVRMMMSYFAESVTKTGQTDGHQRLAHAVRGWVDRATRQLATKAERKSAKEKPLTEEALEQVRADLDHVLFNAFLTAGGVPPDSLQGAEPETVCAALEPMIASYPENPIARWTRLNMRFQQVNAAGNRDHAVALLKLIREDADVVVRVATDAELRKLAVEAMKQVDKVLAEVQA